MILADKIIRHRKKNGWSQEELAEKMNVSRQAVSKWESAQAVPDIDKILMLSEVFGVTTDYLLKDEIEDEESADSYSSETPERKLTVTEVKEYLEVRRHAAFKIAAATFLCILSPIALILLAGASEVKSFGISENFAGAVGIITLLVFIALACVMFIQCDMAGEQWKFLVKSKFLLDHGSRSFVQDKKKAYRPVYTKSTIIGALICILSPIPLFIGAFYENDFFCIIMLCITLFTAGVGVMFFVVSGIQWASFQRLTKENVSASEAEKSGSVKSTVATSYWLITTAIYLICSFFNNDWHITWIVWPVAGVLFGVVMSICNAICANINEKKK